MGHAIKQRVTVQTATASDDGRGGQSVTWGTAVSNLQAAFVAGAAREFVQAGSMRNAAAYRVRLAYHSAVTVKTRLVRVPSGPTYEVVEVIPVVTRGGDVARWLDCAVVEVDA
jgi:SPP1 family predicted phage head-tail adaptor